MFSSKRPFLKITTISNSKQNFECSPYLNCSFKFQLRMWKTSFCFLEVQYIEKNYDIHYKNLSYTNHVIMYECINITQCILICRISFSLKGFIFFYVFYSSTTESLIQIDTFLRKMSYLKENTSTNFYSFRITFLIWLYQSDMPFYNFIFRCYWDLGPNIRMTRCCLHQNYVTFQEYVNFQSEI